MNAERHLFTSEAVCMGHPDKVADQISDAVLDDLLRQDPCSRVACEVMVKSGLVIVAGEITTDGYCEIPRLVKKTIEEIGYTDPTATFNHLSVGVLSCIEPQSEDIALGVDARRGKDIGAGDQGMMFGFACTDTPERMPMPIMLARRIVNRLAEARQKGILGFLRPDGKCQVTVEYEGIRPIRVHTVVVSAQHAAGAETREIREGILEEVVKKVIDPSLLDRKVIYHVNPTGSFVKGGPQADCGLTGRKIIVDTYGGMAAHGGGAFSGKDPTKVDRTGSYYARYAAKNIVAAGLAERVEVRLAYAIGLSKPVALAVDTFGTGTVPASVLTELLEDHFDFTPSGMIRELDLRRPIYLQTARFGHFGQSGRTYTWERTDRADALRRAAG
jgi:S-adenosylmethionine synthetase